MHDFLIGYSLGFYLPVFLILFAAIGGEIYVCACACGWVYVCVCTCGCVCV